ncbi:hypothetical protein BGX27_008565 [Mortierella sp. AM989]|nr:hypothetical protein BGX27_008565 [Mortierella sp. AM989]
MNEQSESGKKSTGTSSPLPSTPTSSISSPEKTLSSVLSPLTVTTRLPAECLQLIITHYDGDLTMLHSLLLVNSTCFHLAVRLLYRSPFKLLKSYDGDKLPWVKYMRQVKLVWLLLSCVMHNQWVMDELPPMDQTLPILRNPIRHRSTPTEISTKDGHSRSDGKSPANPIRDLTVDYLRFYTHHDHATLSDAFPELFPGLACQLMDEWAHSKDMTQLRHTIERAFLLHQPESIISLSIPISRMKIYLEAVPRLPKLECVEFYDIRNWDTGNIEEAITFVREHDRFAIRNQRRFQKEVEDGGKEGKEGEATQQVLRQEAMNQNVHNDSSEKKMAKLIEIKLGGSGDNGIIQTVELYKILQAMQHPRVVDLTEWRGAIMDIMQIPVQTLQILRMRLDRPLPATCPLGNFLFRARSLRELQISIAPTHGRLFRWAVKKMHLRKRLYRLSRKSLDGNQSGSNGSICMDVAHTQGSITKRRLGRLQHCASEDKEEGLKVLSLAGETATVVQALNAAVWGFNDTLETLQANTWKENTGLHFEDVAGVVPEAMEELGPDVDDDNMDSDENTDGSNSDNSTGTANSTTGPASSSALYFSFNPKTPMTRLHTVELKGEVATFAFNFQSLKHCPRLNILRLNTRPCRVEPEADVIDKILANISESLTELELIGPWWITDHHLNQIAKRLPKLRRLRIGHAPTFYTITPIPAIPTGSYQSSESMSCEGLVHAVGQLRELRELWLGVDMVSYHRQKQRNSASTMFLFFSRRSNDKEEDVWTTLGSALGHISEKRVIPLTVEIQHCPTS